MTEASRPAAGSSGSSVTVLTDDAAEVPGAVDGGRLLVAAEALEPALGWRLEPRGLCRGDVCVPVDDPAALVSGDRIDVVAVAGALRRPVVVDPGEAVAAVGESPAAIGAALDALEAPDFTLPDLGGAPVSLSDFDGTKKLLLAFASW